MKIKEIMNKAIAIDEDITIKEAAKIMSDKNIGSLIIVDKEEIQGIITERDVLNNIANLDTKISKIMTQNPVTIDENENIDEAAVIMTEHKVRRLPVLSNGKLAGIVTSTDLIAHAEDLGDEFLFD